MIAGAIWPLPDDVVADIRADAEDRAPDESCGLVLADEGGVRYVSYPNIAPDPRAAFRVPGGTVLKAQAAGTLGAVVHSHPPPHPACPSAADMRGQIATDVPWGIVPVGPAGDAGEPFWWGGGAPRPPLLGRPYRHGVDDCYSLVRDWYRISRDLRLPEVPRAWGWWDRRDPDASSLYEQGYAAAGFVDIDRAEAGVGDAVLMAFGHGGVVSHGAVIVEDGVILHHPAADRPWAPGQLSRRDALARWIPHVRRVLRHRDAESRS